MYRNTTDFCLMMLYPATLLNCLLVLIVYWVGGAGFLRIFSIYDHVIWKKRFTSSFPIQMPFTSLSCLTDLARTSSTMLNRSTLPFFILSLFNHRLEMGCSPYKTGLYHVSRICFFHVLAAGPDKYLSQFLSAILGQNHWPKHKLCEGCGG